jgi:hypothetical protein
MCLLRELLRGRKRLTEPPAGRRDVGEGFGLAVAAGDLERQALAIEVRVGLPVDAPVPGHGHPPGARPLDGRRLDGPAAAHVGDEHQLEVVAPVDAEPHPAFLHTRHPTHTAQQHTFISDHPCMQGERYINRHRQAKQPLVVDGHDAAAVDADLEPGRLGHVEVLPRRVAPAAVVVGQRVVGRAQVGGGDGHRRAADAEPRVRLVVAGDPVALPARGAVVEERRAQRRRVRAVARRVQVAVPTGPTCRTQRTRQQRYI